MEIRSRDNERIKLARRVRDGREPGWVFVEGLRLAEECLRSGLEITVAFYRASEEPRQQRLLDALSAQGVPCHDTAPAVLESLSDTVQGQGIVLLARRPAPASLEQAGLLLGLDRVQDPGNLGTLLRTAEAAGVDGIVLLGGCADVYSPKVLRASMGAAFRLPVVTLADADDLFKLTDRLQVSGVAAAGSGECDYDAHDWSAPTLLLLGNEANGVAPDLLARCDRRLRIPLARGVESLNVAAAGAVMLFEAARQRRRSAAQQGAQGGR